LTEYHYCPSIILPNGEIKIPLGVFFYRFGGRFNVLTFVGSLIASQLNKMCYPNLDNIVLRRV
jgi:hypothetical protein